MTTTLVPRKTAGYGWRPQLPDIRDEKYKPPYGSQTEPLPQTADLTTVEKYPAPYDQGQLGSCTANALAGAMQFDSLLLGGTSIYADVTPSRLFVYWGERKIEGTIGTDAGAALRDGIKVLATLGVPPETDWPYDISKFTIEPPKTAFSIATGDLALQYRALTMDPTLLQLRALIGVEGKPMAFGFTVYESFESTEVAASGIVPLPSPDEQVLGGHAVLAVGYDDSRKLVKVRNSWGTDWGQDGHFWLPYEFFTNGNLSSDYWTITTIGKAA